MPPEIAVLVALRHDRFARPPVGEVDDLEM